MPTPHYGQPRYRAIAEELRRRIEIGNITPGTLLPAESALMAEFRASRGTVRSALAELRRTGFAMTAHGRGTVARLQAAPAPTESEADGPAVQSSLESRHTPAGDDLARLFGIQPEERVLEVQVVTRENGIVRSVVRTYSLTEED
ncbi:GntR family transcriptional regulator [Micromonospora echinofusca]|uniref:GntR family transcriptional regulator n=1 Tax=Micromonospora echinofusca TaxID=47858 RepID=UPI003326F16D